MIADNEIEQQQAQINRAREIAEAQRNARAHVNDGAILAEHHRRASTGENLIPSPPTFLGWQFNELLGRWVHVPQTVLAGKPADQYFMPRALAAVEQLDGALVKLSERTGTREDAAREWLTSQRKTIADALAAFESIGADLGGPLARDLVSRITAIRAALASAYAAKACATRETVETALLEIEKCLADDRTLARDIAAAAASLALPSLPDAKSFHDAAGNTADLERLPAKRPSARQMHRVLDNAFNTSPAVALLHVIYETQPEHELVKLRARAIAEGA